MQIFRERDVSWFSPAPAHEGIPRAMAEAVTRKVVSDGPIGGNITLNKMPAGHVVLPHQHDVDEVIYVLEGNITIDGVTEQLGIGDAVIVGAGTTYGFHVGPNGVRFLIIRPREGSMAMAPGDNNTKEKTP